MPNEDRFSTIKCSCVYICPSAKDMALLAEEVCGCKAELLKGGMGGVNTTQILRHLIEGQPVLIPYPEESHFDTMCY